HRLARGGRHRPADLAGERWVAFPARPRRESFVDFLAARLALIGVHDPDIVPIDSLTAQKRLVEAGLGIALLAETALEEERRTGTLRVVRVLELRASVPVCVVHRKRGYLGPAARALLAELVIAAGAARRRPPPWHYSPLKYISLLDKNPAEPQTPVPPPPAAVPILPP